MKFMRHFESEQNVQQPGVLDSGNPDLSLDGELQALALRDQVEEWNIRRVVSSPALRAVRSGRLALGGLEIPLDTDSRLREVHWGPDGGRSAYEVFGGTIDTSGPWKGLDLKVNPWAESCVEAAQRMIRAVEDWGDDQTLFISHKHALQAMVAAGLGLDRGQMLHEVRIANGQVFEYDPLAPSLPVTIYPLQPAPAAA